MIVGEIQVKEYSQGKVFSVKQGLIACLLKKPVIFDQKILDHLKNNQGAYIREAQRVREKKRGE